MRAFVVHALTERLVAFYSGLGFEFWIDRLRDSCVSAIFASPYQITVSWDKARGLENGNGSPRHLCGLVQARALNG